MTNRSLKRYILNIIAAAAAVVLPCSCSDELDYGDNYPEGEESTVSLKIDVTDMKVMSRTSDTEVNTLWVGIYNAKTGVCTYNKLYGDEQANPAEKLNEFKTLANIECKSGKSYIVAVANPTGYNGFDLSGDRTKKPLADLLAQADTWDKYMSIATDTYMADDLHISINELTSALLMEGAYSTEHKVGDDANQIETVDIRPGNNVLTGAIHLRRLMTQNTLKISATDDIISMEVKTIEIYNVPAYSWLRGRNQSETPTKVTDYANAGDALNPDGSATENAYYPTSLQFNPPDAVRLENGVYTFSFWQYENKRTALEGCTTYADREREYKTSEGKNTGIYTSLCGESGGDVNNNATFVKITADVEYKNPGNLVNPDGLELPSSGSSRTASVTYVVHLGYVNNDAKDFNCYRNSKYTYNITAKSVSDVLVEAFRVGENTPGAEGIVTDVTDKFEILDAHTNVFNIYLTTEEIESFSFTMRTYEYGTPHVVRLDLDGTAHDIPKYEDESFKYYNWIEFVPTGNTDKNKDAHVLAPYPAITDMRPGRAGVYYPHELRSSGLTGQWFTVYVNEYTYEKRYGEPGYGDETGTAWKGYVKQPARQAWFNVRQKISDDGESVYFTSKYALSQQSIQTYYDTDVATCTTALGIEHSNESLGLNIRWTLEAKNPWQFDPDNGRLNVANALNLVSNPNNTIGWDDAMDLTSQQVINGITNTKQADPAGIATNQQIIYNVPANAKITVSGTGTYDKPADGNDPQTTDSKTPQYIQGMFACMNRNRDENGNGKIDIEELKWVLPTSGKYLRIILGRSTLPTPLMDYKQHTLPEKCSDGFNTLYHYMSSDAKIIWAEEGASSSNFANSNQWAKAPWQVRCIRSLGTNLKSTNEQVSFAYDATDKDNTTGGGMVTVSHYYGTALREPTANPIPFHKTDAPENKIAMYGFEVAPAGNSFSGDHTNEAEAHFIETSNTQNPEVIRLGKYGDGGGTNGYQKISDSIAAATPCAHLNNTCSRKGWRVPNQKEILIILRMGVLRRQYKSYTFENGELVAHQQDRVMSMLTCTQEHWANYSTEGSSDLPLSWDYRIATAEVNSSIGTASIKSLIDAVRCVRDLTLEESKKTYQQLISGN